MTHSPNTTGKTVYILGAGFSRDAGFPLQAEILDQIRGAEVDLMGAPRHVLDVFDPARNRLFQFLGEVFPAGVTPSLEDIFTLLDQTIARHEYCRGFSRSDLESVADALQQAILFVLHSAGERVTHQTAGFYRTVACFLIERRLVARQEDDPFSIISLNWDSLLEDTIYWCLREAGLVGTVDIDFCCYTTRLGTSSPHVPSLAQKAKGLYNLKLMKLHGSTNWLLCPNCDRLYTGVGGKEEVWSRYVLPQNCPTCERLPSGTGRTRKPDLPVLEPFIITPTFVKVFDNTHIRMTWHNAYMDLAEATQVVFIGYSLPAADYHLRTLFRRAIRPDASIVVVLTDRDQPRRNTPKSLRPFFPTHRYTEFFGPGRLEFCMEGMKGYFRQVLGAIDLRRRQRRLSRAVV